MCLGQETGHSDASWPDTATSTHNVQNGYFQRSKVITKGDVMLIKTDLVQQSCKRLNFDLAKLINQLQKVVSRERWMTAEKKERRYRTLLSDTGSPELARTQLERIINGNDLVSINYLERGLAASRAVCRIQLRNSAGNVVGYGTGFLIGPGVLMTNTGCRLGKPCAQHKKLEWGVDTKSSLQFD